jgi:hypothetical protein
MPSTPYILTKVALTKAQARKLAQGHPIQLKAAAIKSGNHPVYLTKTQINHITKAAAAGKGARISFSKKQTAHHIKMGAGFFGDLWDGLKKGVSDIWHEGIKPNLGALGKVGVGALGKYVGGGSVKAHR